MWTQGDILLYSRNVTLGQAGLTWGMPTDAERWRFLADHKLTLHTDGGDYMVHWCRTAGPGEPPKFFPVSNGATAEEAVDLAIERYNRKHVKPKGVRTYGRT